MSDDADMVLVLKVRSTRTGLPASIGARKALKAMLRRMNHRAYWAPLADVRMHLRNVQTRRRRQRGTPGVGAEKKGGRAPDRTPTLRVFCDPDFKKGTPRET